MRLFLDLDGVLADFDEMYEQSFGLRPARDWPRAAEPDPPGMWENIRRHGSFYRDMPLMKDALELWHGVYEMGFKPTILTGVPYHQVPEAEGHKREWVRQHFGVADVEVICCRSKDKCLHGKPGDVLVDDWAKYRHLWTEMGGIFILHRSAKESLVDLEFIRDVSRLVEAGLEPRR